MDCFVEPVIGRAFARPGGSQRRFDLISFCVRPSAIRHSEAGGPIVVPSVPAERCRAYITAKRMMPTISTTRPVATTAANDRSTLSIDATPASGPRSPTASLERAQGYRSMCPKLFDRVFQLGQRQIFNVQNKRRLQWKRLSQSCGGDVDGTIPLRPHRE